MLNPYDEPILSLTWDSDKKRCNKCPEGIPETKREILLEILFEFIIAIVIIVASRFIDFLKDKLFEHISWEVMVILTLLQASFCIYFIHRLFARIDEFLKKIFNFSISKLFKTKDS